MAPCSAEETNILYDRSSDSRRNRLDRDSHAVEDLAVVRRALMGHQSATDELIKRLKCIPRIIAAQNARHGGILDEHEIADAAQDALAVIWKKLPEFEGRSNLEGWMYRISTFEFMNLLKRKARRGAHYAEVSDEALGALVRETDEADAGEFERIHAGLELLPQDEAEVLHLKHFEGLTLDQAAERLGQPPSSVRTRYYRGIARMHEFLKNREVTHG